MKKIYLLFFLLIYFSACQAEVSVSLSSVVVYPGKSLAVSVRAEKGVKTAEGNFLDQKFKLFPAGQEFHGVVGIPLEQKPGKYTLNLRLIQENGSEEKIEKEVKVSAYQFPQTWFRLKPAKKKLLVKDLIEKEWREIEKVLLVEEAKKYWQGLFLKPIKAPISMTFGTKEYINGKKSGQHRGIDLAAPIGTKVIAPNFGKVVFAKKLKAFGGTVVIDHGWGIHSLYFHLSKFLKRVGEEVQNGEVIALSGNTGISSGPHLHWGLSVHNLRVDPLQWTTQEM